MCSTQYWIRRRYSSNADGRSRIVFNSEEWGKLAFSLNFCTLKISRFLPHQVVSTPDLFDLYSFLWFCQILAIQLPSTTTFSFRVKSFLTCNCWFYTESWYFYRSWSGSYIYSWPYIEYPTIKFYVRIRIWEKTRYGEKCDIMSSFVGVIQ